MKDFREQEYVAHTKCITESERYAAKGTFVGKPERNKGAQKQELWTEVLEELATRNTFDNQTRSVLEKIAAQPNVPRKKPKFVNFLKSSMRFDIRRAEAIWKIIEDGLEEFKKRAASKQETNGATAGRKESTDVNGESKENVTNGSTEDEISENTSDNNNLKNGNDVNASQSVVFSNALNREGIAKETRKLLKKIQKSENLPKDLTKKKKFIKFLQNDFNLDDERTQEIWQLISETTINGIENGDSVTNGTSRKRKNAEPTENGNNEKVQKLENGNAPAAAEESDFDWEKNITSLFNKLNENNELNLETLKSKVIKKYMKHISGNDDDVTKYEKKFNKQLKKVNSLIKEDGVVKRREQV